MFLKELILQGWQALICNPMRSLLTMLGMVWGLASVVILLAYGHGLGGSVLHAFLNMGNNVLVLWPGQTSMQAGGQRAGKRVLYEYADVEAIRDQVPIVLYMSSMRLRRIQREPRNSGVATSPMSGSTETRSKNFFLT